MKTHRLFVKLLVIFFVSAIIPALIIGVVSYSMTYKTLWNNTVFSTEQITAQINSSLSRMLDDAEHFLKIGEEECVFEYLNTEDDNYGNAKRIINAFETYCGNSSFGRNINNIYIAGNDGKNICRLYGVNSWDITKLTEIDANRSAVLPDDIVISTGNINPNSMYRDNQFVYISMPLIVRPLREPFGTISLEIYGSAITDYCSNLNIAEYGHYGIYDSSGKRFFGTESTIETEHIAKALASDKAGSYVTDVDGRSTLVVHQPADISEWKIIGYVATEDLMRDAYSIQKTLFTILCIVIVSAFLLYYVFTRQMIRPLHKLQATMRVAALGDTSVRFDSNTNDEISEVGNSFNSMMEKLNNMARQDIERQDSLQKASLDLMQAQINPHFLYNTLDTIMWSANAGDSGTVIETVDALATFYRTTLSNGESWVTVAEEIRMIESYLRIQKVRYSGLITDHIDIEPSILSCRMLKLTLQPIVENAIFHGLKDRENGGNIWITGTDDGSFLQFIIRDDGTGMSGETYKELLRKLEKNEASMHVHQDGGFGLENVNARIKLYYGDDSGIDILNSEGHGIQVYVRMKKEI